MYKGVSLIQLWDISVTSHLVPTTHRRTTVFEVPTHCLENVIDYQNNTILSYDCLYRKNSMIVLGMGMASLWWDLDHVRSMV